MFSELPINTSITNPTIDAERCIAELQRGRAIVLSEENNKRTPASSTLQIVQLVETLNDLELESLVVAHDCQLVLSGSRAMALGLTVSSSAVSLQLEAHTSVKNIRTWAGLHLAPPDSGQVGTSAHQGETQVDSMLPQCNLALPYDAGSRHATAALNLASHAHVLPALIMYRVNTKPAELLCVSTATACNYTDQSGELIRLSSARIPLATAKSVELTVFRERHGSAEHVAIIVGQPDFSEIVTVRLHSSCFTGDILGSMKCDCGEQLQRALSGMEAANGGVVLYISQEGRGIGLASKLLAYQLQAQGMDTIDANHHLGFEADERNYSAAVYMLKALGIDNIALVTNNPLKIKSLRQHGIAVHDRVPSPATVNVHNARYLETKRLRAGHFSSGETVV